MVKIVCLPKLYSGLQIVKGSCLPAGESSWLLLLTLREKCPYLELFRSVFSRIRTEYGPE